MIELFIGFACLIFIVVICGGICACLRQNGSLVKSGTTDRSRWGNSDGWSTHHNNIDHSSGGTWGGDWNTGVYSSDDTAGGGGCDSGGGGGCDSGGGGGCDSGGGGGGDSGGGSCD